jgi:hypothetical protein
MKYIPNLLLGRPAYVSFIYVSFQHLLRILAGCGFSGSIPDELGNLAELSFL